MLLKNKTTSFVDTKINMMNTLLEKFTEETISCLKKLSQNHIEERCFEIDCSKLEDYLTNDIRDSIQYKDLFKELETITRSTIYWYEITSEVNNETILEAFKNYKVSAKRPTPALNHYEHELSRTLYVGKVKGCLWGRVIQHLGYHKDATDHGMQLYHWAKPISLKLKLHTLELNEDMYHLIPSLEAYFAKELKPLIGKHNQ